MTHGAREGAPLASSPRVLLVSQPTTAGTARHVADLAAGLLGRGIDITLACPPDGMLTGRARRDGVPVIELPMNREISPVADAVAFVRLLSLCRRLRPDVVHLHSSKAGFLGRLAGRLAGVPVVVFTPHCWSFQSASGRKRRFYLALEKFASRFCDMTVTVSKQEALEAIQEGVLAPEKVRVIPNGVGPRDFEAAHSAVRDIPFVSVGRLDEQKGYTYLLQAFADLGPSEPGARVSIVGDGPLRADLEREAAVLGISDRVSFVGEHDDVGEYLGRSHAFVLSSLWEGLPYTIIEAMAAGLPVICTDVGGCSELVIDGRTGFVVPPEDPVALAGALRRLQNDDMMRLAMGTAGYERAQTLFRVETCVERNASTYEELLEGFRGQTDDITPTTLFGRRGAALLITIAVLFSVGIAADAIAFRDRVYPGVAIGSADVGTLTRDEAVRSVRTLLRGTVVVQISEETSVVVEGSELGFDVIDSTRAAYLVGRVGGLGRRLADRNAAMRGRVSVPLAARDSTPVAGIVETARAVLDREPVDARFRWSENDGSLVIDEGAPGVAVDERALVELLGRVATQDAPRAAVIEVPVDATAPEIGAEDLNRRYSEAEQWAARDVIGVSGSQRVGLSRAQIAEVLSVSAGELVVSETRLEDTAMRTLVLETPHDARFSVRDGAVHIVDGSPGSRLDATATARSLEGALRGGAETFDVALAQMDPVVERADLERLGISTLLATYTTRFRQGQDGRDINIQLASEAFQGKVLGIGEVFSLNRTTGPRNKATGYQESLVFMNGKVVPGIGGGTCQVSSTLYQAALRANLRIVDRDNHSMAVSYMPPGLDATTYYPSIDLKFQNSAGGPILLWSTVSGDRLTVSVYGGGEVPDVRIRTDIKKTVPPKEKRVFVTGLARGVSRVESEGMPGYVVTSYRELYEDGRLVSTQVLGTDEYRPRDRVVHVGN